MLYISDTILLCLPLLGFLLSHVGGLQHEVQKGVNLRHVHFLPLIFLLLALRWTWSTASSLAPFCGTSGQPTHTSGTSGTISGVASWRWLAVGSGGCGWWGNGYGGIFLWRVEGFTFSVFGRVSALKVRAENYIAARKYKYRKSKNRILQETIKTDYFTKYLPKYVGFSYRASLWTNAPPYHTVCEKKWHLSCNSYWMTKFYSKVGNDTAVTRLTVSVLRNRHKNQLR